MQSLHSFLCRLVSREMCLWDVNDGRCIEFTKLACAHTGIQVTAEPAARTGPTKRAFRGCSSRSNVRTTAAVCPHQTWRFLSRWLRPFSQTVVVSLWFFQIVQINAASRVLTKSLLNAASSFKTGLQSPSQRAAVGCHMNQNAKS